MGLIFHKRFFHTFGLVVALFVSCDDASYELDNEFDPENLGLEPPTIFFHFPSGKVNSDGIAEIDSKVTDIDTVELYAYGIDSVAGAHLQIEFDAEVIGIETIEPGGFFKNGDNSPLVFITDEEDGYLNIYLFFKPSPTNVSASGTSSMATVTFTSNDEGSTPIRYTEQTIFKDVNNIEIILNTKGEGSINATQ